jgi:hypothetical protein
MAEALKGGGLVKDRHGEPAGGGSGADVAAGTDRRM